MNTDIQKIEIQNDLYKFKWVRKICKDYTSTKINIIIINF